MDEDDSQMCLRYSSTMDWPSSYDQSTSKEDPSKLHRSLLGTQSVLCNRSIPDYSKRPDSSSLGWLRGVGILSTNEL